jgi:hypothetical protein
MLLALRPVRVGWGREYFFEREEGFSDPWADAMRDQTVRAIDMKNYARAHALGEELLRKRNKDPDSEASNDPRIVALIAEALRLGGGQGARVDARDSGAAASLSFLSMQIFFSSSSCHPWILFVRAMAEPPGDVSCLPERQREGFARGLEIARQRGWALTEWNRVATTGRP